MSSHCVLVSILHPGHLRLNLRGTSAIAPEVYTPAAYTCTAYAIPSYVLLNLVTYIWNELSTVGSKLTTAASLYYHGSTSSFSRGSFMVLPRTNQQLFQSAACQRQLISYYDSQD